MIQSKAANVATLALIEVLAMSLWFVSAAILPELVAESGISEARAAALSSAVQIGFVAGALGFALHGTADRFDPRKVLGASAFIGGLAGLCLLITPVGGNIQILLRGITGAALAGVYPVGMKIIVGWGTKDRGLLIGLVVAALTLGSALPHLLSILGGPNWQVTVVLASSLAFAAGILALLTGLGPYHARAARLDPSALTMAWTNLQIRLAYIGYLGHMWELYVFWAWISAAAVIVFAPEFGPEAGRLASILTFSAIALGGLLCVPAGWFADSIGKARVARYAMMISGIAAVVTGFAFNGPVWLFVIAVLLWGASIIPDSAQFSALVADLAPPERAGSLMTFQTALGFTLTFFTVQLLPFAVSLLGWPLVLASLAIGPAIGVEAMRRLIESRLG
ncbi:MFS transporter [Amaricoccus tamworthensis]|uniref:MFS transporter n=1 Tax=Amaricoccus tamworthensis TaxID=57002 RepID=UPI003C7A7476